MTRILISLHDWRGQKIANMKHPKVGSIEDKTVDGVRVVILEIVDEL